MIEENNNKIKEIKETLEKATYASVVAKSTEVQRTEQKTLHSVVVAAVNEQYTGDQVMERIRKVINAKDGGVEVERIRKAKDRKVIVGCTTREERAKVKERLAKSEELTVEDVKNKDPLVALRDVFQLNSDEDILKALRAQNKGIFAGIEKEENRVNIAFKKRARNPHSHHIIVRVSPKLWQRLTQAGAVHLDLQRVRVVDQSPLVQCSLCLGYGHGRRFCKEALEKCSHCGGPHKKDQCEGYVTGSTPSCCNCLQAKMDTWDHNAFSQECVIRRKWDKLARTAIAYC